MTIDVVSPAYLFMEIRGDIAGLKSALENGGNPNWWVLLAASTNIIEANRLFIHKHERNVLDQLCLEQELALDPSQRPFLQYTFRPKVLR